MRLLSGQFRRLVLELQQIVIGSWAGGKGIRAAFLDDPAIGHDHDAVKIPQGEKPVRDRNNGTAGGENVQSLVNADLRLGVQRRGSFIQE
jgi:hypothetical protein